MRKNYINGDWVDALSNQTKPLINPASEEKIADLPFGNADDYRLAILMAFSTASAPVLVSITFVSGP